MAMVAILSFTCLLLNICSAQFSIVAPVVIISSTNKICLSFIKWGCFILINFPVLNGLISGWYFKGGEIINSLLMSISLMYSLK